MIFVFTYISFHSVIALRVWDRISHMDIVVPLQGTSGKECGLHSLSVTALKFSPWFLAAYHSAKSLCKKLSSGNVILSAGEVMFICALSLHRTSLLISIQFCFLCFSVLGQSNFQSKNDHLALGKSTLNPVFSLNFKFPWSIANVMKGKKNGTLLPGTRPEMREYLLLTTTGIHYLNLCGYAVSMASCSCMAYETTRRNWDNFTNLVLTRDSLTLLVMN